MCPSPTRSLILLNKYFRMGDQAVSLPFLYHIMLPEDEQRIKQQELLASERIGVVWFCAKTNQLSPSAYWCHTARIITMSPPQYLPASSLSNFLEQCVLEEGVLGCDHGFPSLFFTVQFHIQVGSQRWVNYVRGGTISYPIVNCTYLH